MNQNINQKTKQKNEIVCLCNNVSRSTIEGAICTGADTLNKIFDRTTAGVGPCGGSCRRKLGPLLDHYLANGTFPEKIVPDMRGKKKIKPKKGFPNPTDT
ncbi:MAG: (2Fe-2S)-binding protein [Pseudomonadota bacterium]|nr:(2Fe-2S)-binding protein [Pseudomonadota bacterium]